MCIGTEQEKVPSVEDTIWPFCDGGQVMALQGTTPKRKSPLVNNSSATAWWGTSSHYSHYMTSSRESYAGLLEHGTCTYTHSIHMRITKFLHSVLEAKRVELSSTGVPSPSVATTKAAVTPKELATHCRRCTWGVEKMVETIEALLLSLSNATDLLGVPILREKMKDIWEEQRRHVACI